MFLKHTQAVAFICGLFACVQMACASEDVVDQEPVRDESAVQEKSEPIRMSAPFSIYVGFGDPTPSYFGFAAGFQLHPHLQVVASTGYFEDGDFKVRSSAIGARFFPLLTPLSLFLGGGSTYFSIRGSGLFQGLDTSLILPFISMGVDLLSRHGVRAAAGVNFHFPVSIIFPFVQLGYSF